MRKLVECVPNISEGRDKHIIDTVVAAAAEVEGVTLLDVDPGADTNRTVITFVGEPDAVVEGAFRLVRKAAELIDMRKHSGEHPRQGATDVCPFVPVAGVTMEDCVELSRRLGKRVGEELGIPVFLYEYAASKPEWKSLAVIRVGEYEAWSGKLGKPEWAPDFGPNTFIPETGALVTGAREFLIAYNVNVNSRVKKLAHQIALDIRERGRLLRDDKGKIVKDDKGNKLRKDGLLKECRAVGWVIEEYGKAQVSINLTNYHITSVHNAFDTCCERATEYGMRVTGSEIVGLIPLEAMLDAGRHYLTKQGRWPGVSEKELIHAAADSLGLSDVAPFNPKDKIIEYAISGREDSLVAMTCSGFAEELASDSPAPGGGSVASLCGSLSASLSAMVAALTQDKKGYEAQQNDLGEMMAIGQKLKDEFLLDVDRDTDSFNELMEAMRLPKKSDEDKAARNEAMRIATEHATEIPLGVLERSIPALDIADIAAEKGNQNSLSDAGVAALTARTCAEGAYYNVLINLDGLEASDFTADTRKRADAAFETSIAKAEALAAKVRDKLRSALA
jgi:glutamate formiminotransferase